MAGMLGHCDFFEQISETTETGRLTPDMIVKLPGDRRVVVDAKAPRMYLEGLADRTGSGASAIPAGSRRQGARPHDAALRQAVLGAVRSDSRVRGHVPAGRGVVRGGAAGRSGSAGIWRRQESDSGEPADVDRAAAGRQLRLEAGVARARCLEDSRAGKRSLQLRAGSCGPSVEDAQQPGRYRRSIQCVGWLGRA